MSIIWTYLPVIQMPESSVEQNKAQPFWGVGEGSKKENKQTHMWPKYGGGSSWEPASSLRLILKDKGVL